MIPTSRPSRHPAPLHRPHSLGKRSWGVLIAAHPSGLISYEQLAGCPSVRMPTNILGMVHDCLRPSEAMSDAHRFLWDDDRLTVGKCVRGRN